MTVGQFDGPNPPYPDGVILLWTKPISEMPLGWVVCDGNNGTPNLLDKFPRSVPDAATDPGGTGGENAKALATSQLPSHTHSIGSTNTTGDHSHTFHWDEEGGSGGAGSRERGLNTNKSDPTTTNGGHSHNINISTTGSGSSIDNRPTHYEGVYIQKI